MPSTVQTAIIAVAAVAVAGTAAYVATRPGAPATPVSAPAATPAPDAPPPAAKAPEPPPAPAFVPGNSADNSAPPPAPTPMAAPPAAAENQAPAPFAMPPTTQFTTQTQPYSLVRDSAAYVAATPDAPQLYPLRSGTPVNAVAHSQDGKWVIALTEDGKAAYLQTADLGPYDPRLAPKADLPDRVAGVAQAIDTATLTVDGQTVPLAGIKGESGIYAARLQALINSQGGQVTCSLEDNAYNCVLPNGMDIARAGLFNGGAELGDNPSADYRAQQAAAQAGHRGIWK